jgi:hypothetical protein
MPPHAQAPSTPRAAKTTALRAATPHRPRAHRAPPEGLVLIALKRVLADGTLAVEMDPLSLQCWLASSVPPPRFHTVKYAGVPAPASAWRTRIRPHPKPIAQLAEPSAAETPSHLEHKP